MAEAALRLEYWLCAFDRRRVERRPPTKTAAGRHARPRSSTPTASSFLSAVAPTCSNDDKSSEPQN
jgi:hypothetical protein